MGRRVVGPPLDLEAPRQIVAPPLNIPTPPAHPPGAGMGSEKYPDLFDPFAQKMAKGLSVTSKPADPQDEIIPLVSPPEPIEDTPVPRTSPGMGRGLRNIAKKSREYSRMMEEGMTREYEAKAAESDEKASRLKQLLDQKTQLHRQMEDEEAEYSKEQKIELDHYRVLSHRAQQEVDPEHWQRTRTLGQRVAQGIAVAAGAFLEGSSGGRLPNVAQRMIDNYIERDIAAQKANAGIRGAGVDRQLNLMGYMRQAYGDDRKAHLATKARMIEEAEGSLAVIAERTKSPVLQARLMQEMAGLKQKQFQLRAQLVGRGGRGAPSLTKVAKEVKAKADILKYGKQARQAVEGKPLDDKLATRLDAAEQALDTIDELTSEVKKGFNYDLLPRGKQGVRQAKFKQARDRLLDLSLRAKTGAQANAEEIAKEEKLYGDAPGSFSGVADAFGAATKEKSIAKLGLNRRDLIKQIKQVARTAAERGQKLPKRFRDILKAEASRRHRK